MSTTLELRHGDEALTVALTIDGERIRGTVGDRPVEAERLSGGAPPYATAGAVVQEIAFASNGRTHRAVVARQPDRILVALGGRTYVFAAGDAAREVSAAGAGTGTIVAPMPGKVVAVLVEAGARVEHGQPVVVIEAMKMETTLVADVDGEVARIAIAAGDTVDGGVVLIEITPG
ncbi:MAG TPA: biotin/lipoyl-containing protein [Candidatus Limnocylindria bacterium]|nr:biotin/lipoyl-containing protein [Candidatus Limnocylindria bacterium]